MATVIAGLKCAPDTSWNINIADVTAADQASAISANGVNGSTNAADIDARLPILTIQNAPSASANSSDEADTDSDEDDDVDAGAVAVDSTAVDCTHSCRSCKAEPTASSSGNNDCRRANAVSPPEAILVVPNVVATIAAGGTTTPTAAADDD